MNDFLCHETAKDRLRALYSDAEQQRQANQANKILDRHPNFWQRTWRLGHWRLAVRLSQGEGANGWSMVNK